MDHLKAIFCALSPTKFKREQCSLKCDSAEFQESIEKSNDIGSMNPLFWTAVLKHRRLAQKDPDLRLVQKGIKFRWSFIVCQLTQTGCTVVFFPTGFFCIDRLLWLPSCCSSLREPVAPNLAVTVLSLSCDAMNLKSYCQSSFICFCF